jgi:hypothetical protein
VAVFVCTSALCGNFTLPTNADPVETENTMCAAFRETLAAQYNLPVDAVTLTKCELTLLPSRRLLARSALMKRSLQTQNAVLCVRETAAPLAGLYITWPPTMGALMHMVY